MYSKNHEIQFKVTKDEVKLKLLKPDGGGHGCTLTVDLKREVKSKFHAMNMMYTLNHLNILSMKSLGPKVTDDEFLVFIEQDIRDLNELIWSEYYDRNGHIPSLPLQAFVRGIVEGIDFLRKNDLYPGNLSWGTTLYTGHNITKLCNFRTKDEISKEDAQWDDWICIRDMLQALSDHATSLNRDPNFQIEIFCGEIDALIGLLTSSNRYMLPKIKEDVLAEVFFWGKGERTNFITTTVSELIHQDGFKEKINMSSLFELPWNSSDKNRLLGDNLHNTFTIIFDHCNKFRRLKFDSLKQSDCVELACAAYTHEDEIKDADENVDMIFQLKYPKMFVGLKRIVKAQMDAKK